MTATAPTTPARDQHFRFPCNRSFSLPTRIAQPHSLPVRHLNEEAQRVETLFSCATAKVVSFNAAAPGPGHVRHSSTPVGRLSEAEHAEHGTLPWTSATERTLAAGM